MNKKLLEEISRFRLMASYKPGLTLNEQDEDDISGGTKTKIFGSDQKFAQFSLANKELVERDMVRDLNNMVLSRQVEYMKQIEITVIPEGINDYPYVEFTIKVGENVLGTTTWDKDTRTSLFSLEDKKYSRVGRDQYGQPLVNVVKGWKVGNLYVTNLYDEFIKEYPIYTAFFESNTNKFLENGLSISEYVKNQINNQVINFIVKTNFNQKDQQYYQGKNTVFGLSGGMIREKFSKKEWNELNKNKTTVNLGDKTYNATKCNLYDLEPNKGVVLVAGESDKELQWVFSLVNSEVPAPVELALNIPPEFSAGEVEGGLTGSTPTPTPTPPPLVAPIELKLDLINAYAFDEVEKGDSSYWANDGQAQFDAFIDTYNNLKDKYANIWPSYIEFLKKNKVKIYGYASIDRKPGDLIYGGYYGCTSRPNKQSVTVYNQCLSEKRAAQAVKDIVKEIPELDGILIPVGGGETDKFDGKNYLNTKNSDETYQNRRIYGVFPKYETTP